MIIGGDVDLCDGMIVCEVDRGRPVAVPDLPTGAFSMLSDRVEVFYLTWCRGPSCETDIEGGACPIWFRRLGYFMECDICQLATWRAVLRTICGASEAVSTMAVSAIAFMLLFLTTDYHPSIGG